MMKWKVTRSARCASADRSLDYLRKIEVPVPDSTRTTFLEPAEYGGQKKDTAALQRGKRQTQVADLNRKESFVATDCINFKGIFNIGKDKNEQNFSSLSIFNGERQRSRSEIRSASTDRLSIGYHGSPLKVSRTPQGKENDNNYGRASPKKMFISAEKSNVWVRGRKREREKRLPITRHPITEGRTVVTSSYGGKCDEKVVNGRTTVDSSDAGNKFQRITKRSAICNKLNEPLPKPKKANKELDNGTVDSKKNPNQESENKKSNKTVTINEAISVESHKVTHKKGIAPKPPERHKSQLSKTANHIDNDAKNKNSQLPTINESSSKENSNNNSRKNSIEETQKEANETLMSNNGEIMECLETLETKHTASATEENNVQVHVESVSVSDVHDNHTSCIDLADLEKKNSAESNKEIITNEKQIIFNNSSNTALLEEIQDSTVSSFSHKDYPAIDEPDYSSFNSVESDDIHNETISKETEIDSGVIVNDDSMTDLQQNTVSVFSSFESTNEYVKENEVECTTTEIENISEHDKQILVNNIEIQVGDTKILLVGKETEVSPMNSNVIENRCIESEECVTKEKENSGGVNNDNNMASGIDSKNCKTFEIDDECASNFTMFTDLSTEKSCSRSPTPPPRKKLASLKRNSELTKNVASVPGCKTILLCQDKPDEQVSSNAKVRKSFVITIAKQEKGFQSLCANKETSCKLNNCKSENDPQISVTFLCNKLSNGQWTEEQPLKCLRFRSISVPPDNEYINYDSIAKVMRSSSRERKTKDKQNTKKKNHRSRKKDVSTYHMPQAVIDELSKVLENRKRATDDVPK